MYKQDFSGAILQQMWGHDMQQRLQAGVKPAVLRL